MAFTGVGSGIQGACLGQATGSRQAAILLYADPNLRRATTWKSLEIWPKASLVAGLEFGFK